MNVCAYAASLSCVWVVGRRTNLCQHCVMLDRGRYMFPNQRRRSSDAKLVKQESECLLEVGGESVPRGLGQVPHLALEGADGPLPRPVIELLRGVPRFLLALGVGIEPGIHPAAKLRRQLLVVEDDV